MFMHGCMYIAMHNNFCMYVTSATGSIQKSNQSVPASIQQQPEEYPTTSIPTGQQESRTLVKGSQLPSQNTRKQELGNSHTHAWF